MRPGDVGRQGYFPCGRDRLCRQQFTACHDASSQQVSSSQQ